MTDPDESVTRPLMLATAIDCCASAGPTSAITTIAHATRTALRTTPPHRHETRRPVLAWSARQRDATSRGVMREEAEALAGRIETTARRAQRRDVLWSAPGR